MRSQSRESNEAFEFIVTQVDTYRQKLVDSETRLQSFRARTTDARPGTENNLDARILDLRRKIEKTELEYAESYARAVSLSNELNKVASTADTVYRESQYLAQVGELRAEVDLLLLSYTDDYPDVVRIRRQIEDLKSLAASQKRQREIESKKIKSVVIGRETFVTNRSSISPIYQQLSGEASRAHAYADSLKSRLNHTRVLLKKELSRLNKTSKVESELAELSRDYQVNQDIYQDLLRRRESARVSMTLDKERQGVLYRIQEPASFPILPTGIRFMHFLIAGLLLGLMAPFVYLVGYLQVDPRVRLPSAISDGLDLPLLAVVPHMSMPHETAPWYRKKFFLLLIVITVLVIYAAVSWTKLTSGS
jgi:polysaccharide chain length determinant protein (PEP-CTERM system associated)